MDNEKLNEEMQKNSLADRNRNISLSNSTDNQLSGQLMLLCTVFLTVAFLVISSTQIEIYTLAVRILIFQMLILTFISIGCGIKNYFVNIDFYSKWASKSHENYNLFICRKFKDQSELETKFNENLKDLETHSSSFWLKMQILALILAAILLLIAIAILVF